MTTQLHSESREDSLDLPTRGGGRSVIKIRNGIRDDIIAGRIVPGASLSSAQLCQDYGVSRTPVREAVRMLQEEGFLTIQSNHRPRVTIWSADELESLFTQRILLVALCTRITVPMLNGTDIAALGEIMATLAVAEETHDHVGWREADVAFHQAHTRGAPAALVADLERLNTRALMFRHMWLGERHSTMSLAFDDHQRIYDACLDNDPLRAAETAARHLATVALTLLARVDPSREPYALREAVKFASQVPESMLEER